MNKRKIMGDLYLNVEELVGVVGMLSSRDGSTVKDITSLLESMHGPVRRDVIQDGLRSLVSSGVLVYRNRRYKVCKPRNISESESLFDLEDCSSYKADSCEDADLGENYTATDSSISAQMDENLEGDSSYVPSEQYSVEEILSVKSLPSSSQFSTGSDVRQQRKNKRKRRLIVKLPQYKKDLTVDKDTNVEKSSENLETEKEVIKTLETPDKLNSNTEDCSKQADRDLSMNDVLNEVMRKLVHKNEPNENEKEVVKREDFGNKSETSSAVSKTMAEVMRKVHGSETSDTPYTSTCVLPEAMKTGGSDQPGNVKSSETPSRDVEKSRGVKFLSDTITDIMKRIYRGESSSSRDPPEVVENDNLPERSDSQQTTNRAGKTVGTDAQNVQPSTSGNKFPKLVTKEKRTKQQQTDRIDAEDGVGYFTRSRARSNDLRRSRTQSPSNSDVSSKKSKFQ